MRFRLILMLLAAAAVAGCGKDDHDHAGHDHDHDDHEHAHDDDDADGMAGLSAADRKLAEAQKICPVSGEPLGSMGTPIQVTADGRTAFLCCEACRKRFERDPKKYFAKIDEAR